MCWDAEPADQPDLRAESAAVAAVLAVAAELAVKVLPDEPWLPINVARAVWYVCVVGGDLRNGAEVTVLAGLQGEGFGRAAERYSFTLVKIGAD